MPEPRPTVLNAAHRSAGARLVDFAGWEMPIHYRSIIDEHRAVRTRAGMFDTSHMGQILIAGPGSGRFLDLLLPNDIAGLAVGQARYSPLCRPDGGIVDDLMVYRLRDEQYLVVVNAARRAVDLAWIADHRPAGVEITDWYETAAMIAVQGPAAIERVSPLFEETLSDLPRFGIRSAHLDSRECLVARTGYTGEDGIELFLYAADAERVWNRFLDAGITPCGLGARDTLRLEAALPLYGNDIDETTNPLEAGLGWTVKLDKPDFVGKSSLVAAKAAGLHRRLVGFAMTERGIARHGHPVLDDETEVGIVTSGTFGPTVDRAIGLAYVPTRLSALGTPLTIAVRDRRLAAEVVARPFYRRSGQG